MQNHEKNELVYITLTPSAYQDALEKAGTISALRALQLCGVPVKEYYSRAELSAKFGRGKIDRMIDDGVIKPHSMDGGRPKYKLTEVLTTIQ